MENKQNQLLEQSINFAVDITVLCKTLNKDIISNVFINQIVRSSSSVMANITEANNAESIKDFRHKLNISLKECGESESWLLLMKRSMFIKENDFKDLTQKCLSIKKMLISSIITVNKKFPKM